MNESDETRREFVLKRTCTPAEAITLLMDRFPTILKLAESSETLAEMGPYYVYGTFADEVRRRNIDQNFLKSFGLFANELSDSTDPMLRDLLVTAILERVADDPGTAAKVRPYLGPRAQAMLNQVEKDWFGRATDSIETKET